MFRKQMITVHKYVCLVGLVLILPAFIAAQDMRTEDLIAKHLESIGAKEKRDGIKNRLALGLSTFESKLPSKSTGGKAVIASDRSNLMFLTSFSSNEYPFEKIGI